MFLNHGSFGACPIPVLQEQQRLRERLESQPVRFFVRESEGLLDAARAELAAFLAADPEDLVFVPNATTGVNAVVRSLDFRGGHELLTTDHAYNACKNALDYVAGRCGARVVVARVPFPIASPDQVVDAVLACASPRTKLALIDHVTSATGLVFPVDRIAKELSKRGIETLVDGAHAPGMIPLRVPDLGAAYYTGNCHKWLCAPKGAAFLWVRSDRRPFIRPPVISHGANATVPGRSRFRMEFDYTGTTDITAPLCVPAALRFMATIAPWREIMARNRALALQGRAILKIKPPAPDSMIGSIVSLPIPDAPAPPPTRLHSTAPLQDVLFERYGIEVPVFPWPAPPKRILRISAQVYNEPAEYQLLADALASLNVR